LTIDVGVISSIDIDLFAEIAKLVVLVGAGTLFAKPHELAFTELPPGPRFVIVAEALVPTEAIGTYSESPFSDCKQSQKVINFTWILNRMLRVYH
jgi:hypothetical protein